ncbi:hypothetical protein N5V62_24195, partial [Escherichia coli]|nr:hypothetical protein [Escherichia coli]
RNTAYKLRKHLADYVNFQIFEKSPELGGTWYENKYPGIYSFSQQMKPLDHRARETTNHPFQGCACDVPSHCYQYSFAPNPNWSKLYCISDAINAKTYTDKKAC